MSPWFVARRVPRGGRSSAQAERPAACAASSGASCILVLCVRWIASRALGGVQFRRANSPFFAGENRRLWPATPMRLWAIPLASTIRRARHRHRQSETPRPRSRPRSCRNTALPSRIMPRGERKRSRPKPDQQIVYTAGWRPSKRAPTPESLHGAPRTRAGSATAPLGVTQIGHVAAAAVGGQRELNPSFVQRLM